MSYLAKFIARRQVEGSSVLRSDGSTGTSKSDTLKLQAPAHGIHAKAAGTVTYLDMDGNTAVITVLAGQDYARGIQQVKSTGTTLADTEYALLYGV